MAFFLEKLNRSFELLPVETKSLALVDTWPLCPADAFFGFWDSSLLLHLGE